MTFQRNFNVITDGENVNASVSNRTARQLISNVNYLNEQMGNLLAGAGNYAYGVTVSSDTVVGSPVYLDSSTGAYKSALAATNASEAEMQVLELAETSRVWGVVIQKHSSTTADLLLAGLANIDISAAIYPAAAVAAGTYFLSGAQAGRLSKTRPAVGIPVLRSDGNGKVLVIPNTIDLLHTHLHYKFYLQPQFCGDSVTAGTGTTTINNVDTDLEGWLPADHASFGGNAPSGARFGYNIAANSKLSSLWPPIPLQSAYLEWNQGDDGAYGQSVPLGSNQFAVIDQYGIWWFGDADGQRPWDESRNATGHTENDWYADHIEQDDADLENWASLILWFNRPSFANELSVVTSLTAASGSRLSVVCPGTEIAASTGPLEIDLDLDFVVGNDTTAGYLAVKGVTDGDSLLRGPVVEGVYPASDNVQMSGDATSTVTINDESVTLYHGKVSVDINPETNNRELETSQVQLLAATEETIKGLSVISLPTGRKSAINGIINVPTAGLPANPTLKLRIQLAGGLAGTFPSITFRRRRIARGTSTPVTLPGTDTEVAWDLSDITLSSALQYVEVETVAFTVAAGDTVMFNIERSAGDGYSGALYLMQILGVLTSSE